MSLDEISDSAKTEIRLKSVYMSIDSLVSRATRALEKFHEGQKLIPADSERQKERPLGVL